METDNYLHRRNRTEYNIAVLRRKKRDFTVLRSGSFASIVYNDRVIKFLDRSFGGIKGAHLSTMVRRDIDKLIPSLPADVMSYVQHPPSTYVNLAQIDKMADEHLCHVDMTNCYWATALLQNIITQRTYIKGLQKPAWKMGRNAAIGALDKRVIRETYIEGVLVNSERVYMKSNYRYARMRVINRVDELARQCIEEVLKDRFVMFLTDCFVIKAEAIRELYDYLAKCGYNHTSATVIIKEHNPKRKIVYWDKIDTFRKRLDMEKPGRFFVAHEKNKFIHYTDKGIYNI